MKRGHLASVIANKAPRQDGSQQPNGNDNNVRIGHYSSSSKRLRSRMGPPPRLQWPAPISLAETDQSQSETAPAHPLSAELSILDAADKNEKYNKEKSATSMGSSRNNTNGCIRHFEMACAKKRPTKRGKETGGKNGTTHSNHPQKRIHHDKSTTGERNYMLWTEKYAPKTALDLCVAPKKINEIQKWIEDSCSLFSNKRIVRKDENRGCSRMLLLTGSPGIGKSSCCRVIASELNLNILEWKETLSNRSFSNCTATVPYHSPLDSFEEFLVSAGGGFSSLEFERGASPSFLDSSNCELESSRSKQSSVILIEETPNLHDRAAEFRFRDVSEGSVSLADIEKFIDPATLHSTDSSRVQTIHINPVTNAKMKKVLDSILRQENISKGNSAFAIEQLCSKSGGDIRGAIHSLQFHFCGSKAKGLDDLSCRDTKLNSFHALGKLLYAKRKKGVNVDAVPSSENLSAVKDRSLDAAWRRINWKDTRLALNFDPEEVIESNDMSLENITNFISYHSVSLFTDESELSDALATLSDAAFLLERQYDSQRDRGDNVYPQQYVCSLTSRAVANANKHPAPTKFRSWGLPEVVHTLRKMRDNKSSLDCHMQRLCLDYQMICVNECVGSVTRHVTETFAYMRNIFPQEMNFAIMNLHSTVRPMEEGNQIKSDYKHDQMKEAIDRQHRLLELDDIIEEDYTDDFVTMSQVLK